MAYVIFSANGDEIDRRELSEPVIIGRAPDSGICIRDILLSRRHCSLEIQNDKWIVTDLGSRNGTFLAEERIQRHILRDGDSLRMGRTWMIFRAGAFVPNPRTSSNDNQRNRPVDPNEAMAGTVVGFELLDPGEAEYDAAMPIPQPRPRDPRSYERDAAPLVKEISSNSWDAQHEQAPNRVRVNRPAADPVAPSAPSRPALRSKSRVSFALQANEAEPAQPRTPVVKSAPGKWTIELPKPSFKLRPLTRVQRRIVAAGVSIAITVGIGFAWLAIPPQQPSAVSVAGIVSQPSLPAEPAALVMPKAEDHPADASPDAQTVASIDPSIESLGAEDIEAEARRAGQPRKQQLPETRVIVEVLLRALLIP